MAPLSFFRGGGDAPSAPASSPHGGSSGLSASAARTSTDAHYTRARTPDPSSRPAQAHLEEAVEPSPSRLNPSRLLRRKNSRSLKADKAERQQRDRDRDRDRDREREQDVETVVIRASSDDHLRDVSRGHRKLGSHGSERLPVISTPSSPTTSTSTTAGPSTHPQLFHPPLPLEPSTPNTGSGSTASNYGSVRSMRSIKSEGNPGESEVVNIPAVPVHLGHSHPFFQRPETPPLAFPTPLSPPRRPPRSPNPPPPPRGHHIARSDPTDPSPPSSSSATATPVHLRHHDGSTSRPGSPDSTSERERDSPADREPSTDPSTAAWLARRPSARTRKPKGSTPDRRLRRVGSTSSSTQASGSGESADEPFTPTMSNSPQAGNGIASNVPGTTCAPPSHPLSTNHVRPRTPDRQGYEVSVVCTSQGDEVRWEVVMRRAPVANGADATPNGPITLSTGDNNAVAPPLASSVNLSLALDVDQPSGKMVFISLPSDTTPTRVRTRSVSSPRGGSGQSRAPLSFALRDAGARESFGNFPDYAGPGGFIPPQPGMPTNPGRQLNYMRNGGESNGVAVAGDPLRSKRQGSVWGPAAGDVFVSRSSLSSSSEVSNGNTNTTGYESARGSLEGTRAGTGVGAGAGTGLETAMEGVAVGEV